MVARCHSHIADPQRDAAPWQKRLVAWIHFALLVLCFAGHSSACEMPDIPSANMVHRSAGEGVSISWNPVATATHYEMRFSLRVPEGKFLLQNEIVTQHPFYRLSSHQFPMLERLHLLVDVVAVCEGKRSTVRQAEFAIESPPSPCLLEKGAVNWISGQLRWSPVQGAESYVVCRFSAERSPGCHETSHHDIDMPAYEGMLVSVTPVCKGQSGTAYFLTNAVGRR